MANPFTKKEEEVKAPPAAKKKRTYDLAVDEEEAEIKKLDIDDFEDVISIMRRAMFEIGKAEAKQIEEILKLGASYGAYVDRMLVAVGLAWPISFDRATKVIGKGPANALYLEDVALLLAYEGKGIRQKLVKAREDEARALGLKYAVAIASEEVPKEENVIEVIKERGTKIEKVYLERGYSFFKSKIGLIAFKEV
ncbi:MAG: hypothetical protein QXY05_04365 [Candidatus Anstonellales archaeon]